MRNFCADACSALELLVDLRPDGTPDLAFEARTVASAQGRVALLVAAGEDLYQKPTSHDLYIKLGHQFEETGRPDPGSHQIQCSRWVAICCCFYISLTNRETYRSIGHQLSWRMERIRTYIPYNSMFSAMRLRRLQVDVPPLRPLSVLVEHMVLQQSIWSSQPMKTASTEVCGVRTAEHKLILIFAVINDRRWSSPWRWMISLKKCRHRNSTACAETLPLQCLCSEPLLWLASRGTSPAYSSLDTTTPIPSRSATLIYRALAGES